MKRAREGDDCVKQCRAVLKHLQKNPAAYAFLTPVDWKALKLPTYPKMIKKPMARLPHCALGSAFHPQLAGAHWAGVSCVVPANTQTLLSAVAGGSPQISLSLPAASPFCKLQTLLESQRRIGLEKCGWIESVGQCGAPAGTCGRDRVDLDVIWSGSRRDLGWIFTGFRLDFDEVCSRHLFRAGPWDGGEQDGERKVPQGASLCPSSAQPYPSPLTPLFVRTVHPWWLHPSWLRAAFLDAPPSSRSPTS